jgi:endogenous inhibitor of DNA gyrase (YacG/DUF329 family)
MAGRSSGAEVLPLRTRGKCPVCGKPSERATHPFCSKRCADIDLGRWLTGGYSIPGTDSNKPDDDDGGEN